MKRAIVFIVILCAACSDPKPGKAAFSKNEQIGLVTERGSAMRIEPYVYSSKVGELAKGEKVEVLESSKEMASIARTRNYWYRVRNASGLTGWVYGGNIKVFAAGSDFSAGNFAKQIKEEEQNEVLKELVGKWWSVNTREEFTQYWVSLFKDGKYEARYKDSGKLYKGQYTLNLADSTITFDNDTPLGKELKFSERGLQYYIEYTGSSDSVRFKKISSDPASVEEVETVPEPVKAQDTTNVTEQQTDTDQ